MFGLKKPTWIFFCTKITLDHDFWTFVYIEHTSLDLFYTLLTGVNYDVHFNFRAFLGQLIYLNYLISTNEKFAKGDNFYCWIDLKSVWSYLYRFWERKNACNFIVEVKDFLQWISYFTKEITKLMQILNMYMYMM